MKTIAEFKECPDCKVDARLMDSIARNEIAKGNVGSNAIGHTQINVICNIDLKRPPIAGGRIPGARVFKDICTKCGREYTVRIDTGYVTLPTIQGMPPTFS